MKQDILSLTFSYLNQKAENSNTQSDYDVLVDVIHYHTQLYYVQQSPVISDYEYDQLFALCKKMESDHPDWLRLDSPTQRIGSDIQDGFSQAPHPIPLLSLENSYNAEDLRDRSDSISKLLGKLGINQHSYFMEPKFDGLSIELVYENGILVQAITRGDGTIGDDVTANIRTIHSVPLKLTTAVSLRVRGEVIMPKSEFNRINNDRAAAGEPLFANPRNACAGSIRQLDPSITAQRGLLFKPYEILSLE